MRVSPRLEAHLHEVAAELVTNGSIEFSTGPLDQIGAASELLPHGTSVYVPWPRKRDPGVNLEIMRNLHRAGFEPVPHVAARNVSSAAELSRDLEHMVRDFAVHRVMLIGGDRESAAGPFRDSAGLMASGVLSAAGIKEVGVAGYPEGHPRISPAALQADLEQKMELAAGQGLGLEVVTQFSFVPSRVVEYCAELARALPETPVYVGMAGPAPLATLRRFARYCGVSAPLRALMRMGVSAAETAAHTDPDEQLSALTHYAAARESCNVIGVHLYSFGGFNASARWMHGLCHA